MIFEAETTARRAAGGKQAVRHSAHTRTAGSDALPHYHPTDSAGNKLKPHGFIRDANRILIPGAALGVGLFGDNLLGQTVDFVNPLSDVQSFTDLMDRSVIPTIFGFVDDYLMGPGRDPIDKHAPKEPKPKVDLRMCFGDGNCQVI